MTRKKLDLSKAHPWLVETLDLINNRRHDVTLEQIAEAAESSASWVGQLSAGLIADPSVNRIGRIRDYLKQREERGEA